MTSSPSTVLIRTGSAQEIAASLPTAGSVVFASGHLDASQLIDQICDRRGSPASLDCRVQVATDRDALLAFLKILPIETRAYATPFAAALWGQSPVPGVTFRGLDALDAAVARLPASGGVAVCAHADRVLPVAERIREFGGEALAANCLILVAESAEGEAFYLSQVPDLPVIYDLDYPAEQRTAVDRIAPVLMGTVVPKAGQGFVASFSGDRVEPAPAAATPDVDPSEASPGETFPERLARQETIARKIRIARRRFRRSAGAAELRRFVDSLPGDRPFVIVTGSNEHARFIRSLLARSDRAGELQPFARFLHQTDIARGAEILSVVCTGMGGDAGDLPVFPAPGTAKTLERAKIRNAIAAIHAAHPDRPLTYRSNRLRPGGSTIAPSVKMPEITVRSETPLDLSTLSDKVRDATADILRCVFADGSDAPDLHPVEYPWTVRGESAVFPFGSILWKSMKVTDSSVSDCRDLVVYDGPFAAVEVPAPAIEPGASDTSTELTLSAVDPDSWVPVPAAPRIGWICPRCDTVLSPDLLRCDCRS